MFSANTAKEEGNRLASQGRYLEALQNYEAAIDADQTFVTAWFNKGLMHKKLQQYAEALIAFERVLAIDPSYFKAKFNQGDVFFLQGQYQKAWSIFRSGAQEKTDHIESHVGKLMSEQQIAAKVVFANVDLKLDKDGAIKILEFGKGMQSGFDGLQLATDKNIVDLLQEKFKEMALPPLTLNALPGVQAADDSALEKALNTRPSSQSEFLPECMKSYQLVYGGSTLKPVADHILKIDDNLLDFIFENKKLTHDAFVETDQLVYRPTTFVFKREANKNLASNIKERLPNAQQFAIKAPDQEQGKGVIVVNKAELNVTLQCLLMLSDNDNSQKVRTASALYFKHFRSKNKPFSKEKLYDDLERFGHLNDSDSGYFLVEEYITNVPVAHQDKVYDPTMRVAFLFIRDNHQVRCEPFACYWKLPSQSIDSTGDLRDKTVSSFSKTRHDSVCVSTEHQALVYSQLRKVIPIVLETMIRKDMPAHIEKEEAHSSKQKIYKADLWMHFANTLASRGQYLLSGYYLSKAETLVPNHSKLYHQKGTLLHLKAEYSQAIENYDKALEINPYNSATYYRRGLSWYALNDKTKSKEDFDQAIKRNPSYADGIVGLQFNTSMISREELAKRIDNIQRSFLTSNNIVSRAKYPHYYNHPSIPNSLKVFKEKLIVYRQKISELIEKQPPLSLPNVSQDMRDLSMGTFAHQICAALTVSLFGMGDCGESSTRLGFDLIQSGFGNLAFVAIRFLDAKEEMERHHSFLVVNLPTLSYPKNKTLSVYEFFKMLSPDAIIADPFLGLSFAPTSIPSEFNEYLKAYGGRAIVVQCPHFYNVPKDSSVFNAYLDLAKKIEKELKSKNAFAKEELYRLNQKIPIEDTALISLLKQESKLSFYGVRDENDKVDAIVESDTAEKKANIQKLQRNLHGHGRFFTTQQNKKMFVIEGINLAEENPCLIRDIQNVTCKK